MSINEPSPAAKNKPWFAAAIALIIAVTIILIWGISRSPQNAFDDAFITYRYADNLRQGLGLRYNADEWVLGTTTPLFALLLAGLGVLIPDTVLLGHGLGVGGWLAAAFFSYCFFKGENRPAAALIAPLLVAFTPILYASLGMEAPFLVALMLAVACAWLREKFWVTVGLAAALLLTRQDTALWLLILGLEIWRRRRKESRNRTETFSPQPSTLKTLPWREGAMTALLTLPWWFYAWWRYGSPFPNSAAAKIGQETLMPVAGQPPFGIGIWRALFDGQYTVTNLIVLVLIGLAIVWMVRRERRFLWLVIWLVVYAVAYTWLGVVSFPWYFVPPIIILHLLTAFGLGILLGDEPLPRNEAGVTPPSYSQMRLMIAAALLLILVNRAGRMVAVREERGYREAYTAVGDWLAQNTEPTDRIATIEIGVVGYRSARPVLDTQGLISADMTSHQLGWGETLVYALNAHRPEYVLVLPNTAWDTVITQWWFQARYAPVAQFNEATIYGHRKGALAAYRVDDPVAFAAGIVWQGVDFGSQTLEPGEWLTLWLEMQVTRPQPRNYLFTLFLSDTETGEWYAIMTAEPFDGLYRSALWQPGDNLSLPFRLPVPENLPAGTYRLGLLIYDPALDMGLPLADTPEQPGIEVQRGWLTAGEPVAAAFPAPLPLNNPITWDNGLSLTAVGWPNNALQPGDTLPIQFLWQTAGVQGRDLTLFVHLVDGNGTLVAQQDEKPGRGRWPVPGWPVEQAIPQRINILLPETLPPGFYHLRVGWYDERGRIPLHSADGDAFSLDNAVQVTRDQP